MQITSLNLGDINKALNEGFITWSTTRVIAAFIKKQNTPESLDLSLLNKDNEIIEICKELDIKYPESIVSEIKDLCSAFVSPILLSENILSSGIKVNITFYKKSGKFYEKGVVDLGDIEFWDSDLVKPAILKNQKTLVKDWHKHDSFKVCVQDTLVNMLDKNYKYTVNRLYSDSEF
jgi:hypothetical protein